MSSTNSTDGARAHARSQAAAARMRVPASPDSIEALCGPKPFPRGRMPRRCWGAAPAYGWATPAAARARTC